ncbi:MAG: DUF4349 domain-containing protein [Hyphomonas sp.]
MKIRLWIIAATSALTLAACGASDSGYDSRPSMAPEPERALQKLMPSEAANEESEPRDREVGAVQYIAYMHSIGMRLPVKVIEPTMQAHIDSCNKAGPSVCVVTNSWLNAYSDEEASASLQLRATPDWIEKFLAGVESEAEAAKGEITNRQTTAEDLTVQIIDSDARLKAQVLLQERIEKLLADRPGTLGELLETQRELARVNGDIDSLKSTLAALRQRVSMSQLSVSYETKRNPVSQGALAPLGDAFGSFFYNLSSAIAAVVTAFAVGLPWLLLIGALLWIWLRLIWPRIRRKKPQG